MPQQTDHNDTARALRTIALEHGDHEIVDLCERALDGEGDALPHLYMHAREAAALGGDYFGRRERERE